MQTQSIGGSMYFDPYGRTMLPISTEVSWQMSKDSYARWYFKLSR